MKLISVIISTILMVIGLAAPSEAGKKYEEYRWEFSKICVTVPNGVSEDWTLPRVHRQWNQAQEHVTLVIEDTCVDESQILNVNDYSKTDNNGGYMEWKSWTYPFYEKGIIRLNWHYYKDSSKCRRASLAAHEYGHAMGLTHIETNRDDVLMGVNAKGEYTYDKDRCGEPGQNDINRVNALYP